MKAGIFSFSFWKFLRIVLGIFQGETAMLIIKLFHFISVFDVDCSRTRKTVLLNGGCHPFQTQASSPQKSINFSTIGLCRYCSLLHYQSAVAMKLCWLRSILWWKNWLMYANVNVKRVADIFRGMNNVATTIYNHWVY